ncbi:MAG: hypothetical protein DMG65_13180 [Candidatus Angelobacter sp. Gp1-AA117]|nr:MAG: hypothetical protein DMG65_13180 [Candidatus Angelobacter sp. Gp1-AA117]
MKFLSSWEGNAYFLLRIVFGFLYTCHGLQKLFLPGLLHGEKVPAGFNIFFIGAVIELVAGVLIFFGFFTRCAAFVASGEMAVAYFKVHAPHGFFPIVNHGELAVIYCFVALYIACRGAGRLGIDKS